MAEGADKASKTEPPSGKRLDDARAEGKIPKSPDIAPLLALATISFMLMVNGGQMAQTLVAALTPFFAHPDQFDLSGDGGRAIMVMVAKAVIPFGVLMLAGAAAGAVGNIAQQGWVFSLSRIQPDFSKLNPFGGFSRLFSIDGVAQNVKSLAKLAIVAIVTFMMLAPKAPYALGLAGLQVGAILPLAAELIRPIVTAILVLLAVVAFGDWFWQRYRFMENLKMTKQEVKDEQKDMDGDPQIKGKRRQIRFSRAKQRMMQAVPKATVVVMNPTHFAVALRYVQGEDAAPVCVAKGTDAVALRIRAIAEENSVPVIEDPPLARALFAAVEIEETIPRQHFEAVARIIGFIFAKARDRARPARIRPLGGAPSAF